MNKAVHLEDTHHTMMADTEKIVCKGLSDKNIYVLHKLKNGMKCLLISPEKNESEITKIRDKSIKSTIIRTEIDVAYHLKDKKQFQNKSEMFALSLSVNVGSFNDPTEAQGLAHLLEHALFINSERYPEENHFDNYIRQKSGYTNAETGFENTNFYFEVPIEYAKEALDIFASMFQVPRLENKLINKEMQILECEFQIAAAEDEHRIQRLLSMCANEENPAGKFAFGNSESLNYDDLNKRTAEFWRTNYSASRMTLTVQCKQPTHTMIEWIDNIFDKVPTDSQSATEFKISQDPFCQDLFHKIFKVESVSNLKKITFYWYLPPIIKLYKTKPLSYISWLIGHEGKGTLINYLRRLNYALELNAGVGDDFSNNSIYSMYSIIIELTDLGYQNINKIIELTFSYLNLIKEKGISEQIFKQIKIASENSFNFCENETAIDYVSELSKNMLIYDEKDYLRGPKLFYEYSPEIIAQYLNLLTVNRVAIFIQAKNFCNSNIFLEEPIFGTKYLAINFKKGIENTWSTIKPHPFFKIPIDNQYLTTDFSILPLSTYHMKYPEKIFENEYIELWFKQDNYFKLPRMHIMLYFVTDILSKSLENYMLLDLFLESIKYLICEESYPAYIAQIDYNFQMFTTGFELTFNGFNEKLPLFLNFVLYHITEYKKLINEDIFSVVKSKVIYRLKCSLCDPNIVLSDLKQSIIQDPEWNVRDRLNCVEMLDYKQFYEFKNQLSKLYCRALIQGNINQMQAIEISKKVVITWNYQPLPKECFPVVSIKRLERGDQRIKLRTKYTKDNNCTSYKYYQFDKCDIMDAVKYELLELIIEGSAFDELRVKQCLGYDIGLSRTCDNERYGFIFKISHQIDKFSTEYVLNKMDEFLKSFWKNLNDTNLVKLIRDALIKTKKSPDVCLAHEFSRNKYEILNGRFKFNKLELELEGLTKLEMADIKYIEHLFDDSRVLSIEIIPNDNEKDEENPTNKKTKKNFTYINNFNDFKNSLNTY